MRKQDIQYAGWFADFERRCEEQGYSARQVALFGGVGDNRTSEYRHGVIPSPKTRMKLENALADYVPDALCCLPAPEESSAPEPEKEHQGNKNATICDGDKIRCPYLTYTSDRKGFCPLQKCRYIVKEEKHD